MSLQAVLARTRQALTPTYPIMLGGPGTGAAMIFVSPRVGFPYILNRITTLIGETHELEVSHQVYIGDAGNAGPLETSNFARVWISRGDNVSFGFPVPRLLYKTPVTFSPRLRIERSPTFLKVLWLTSVAGQEYWTLLDLIPL